MCDTMVFEGLPDLYQFAYNAADSGHTDSMLPGIRAMCSLPVCSCCLRG